MDLVTIIFILIQLLILRKNYCKDKMCMYPRNDNLCLHNFPKCFNA